MKNWRRRIGASLLGLAVFVGVSVAAPQPASADWGTGGCSDVIENDYLSANFYACIVKTGKGQLAYYAFINFDDLDHPPCTYDLRLNYSQIIFTGSHTSGSCARKFQQVIGPIGYSTSKNYGYSALLLIDNGNQGYAMSPLLVNVPA